MCIWRVAADSVAPYGGGASGPDSGVIAGDEFDTYCVVSDYIPV